MKRSTARQEKYRAIANKINSDSLEFVIDSSPDNVRTIIEKAGNQIASVHFKKRSDGSIRKMAYRLHVKNPTVAKAPKGKINKKNIDKANSQMTVFDVNKTVRQNGEIIGRGAWRTIPLENVLRVCIKGKEYLFAPSL